MIQCTCRWETLWTHPVLPHNAIFLNVLLLVLIAHVLNLRGHVGVDAYITEMERLADTEGFGTII